MRPDSPFFSHSLNVLQTSPLFKGIGEKQLAEMLVSLRRKLTLISDFSHEELANMTGSVRTVISRHMMKLKKDGIIRSKRKHLEIKNLHSLLEHAEKHIGL